MKVRQLAVIVALAFGGQLACGQATPKNVDFEQTRIDRGPASKDVGFVSSGVPGTPYPIAVPCGKCSNVMGGAAPRRLKRS